MKNKIDTKVTLMCNPFRLLQYMNVTVTVIFMNIKVEYDSYEDEMQNRNRQLLRINFIYNVKE